MDARPNSPAPASSQSLSSSGIKTASPDIIIFDDETLSPEVMADLVFESIGGQEIISISRNDMINGQNITYQPIKNVSSLYSQYNPQNVLGVQNTDRDYFKNFSIRLSDRIQGSPNVFTDAEGNLVIEVVNMLPSESIEVESLRSISTLNDTIY